MNISVNNDARPLKFGENVANIFPDIARHFKHYTYLDSIPVPVITGTLLVIIRRPRNWPSIVIVFIIIILIILIIFIIIPSHFSGTSRRTRPTGLSG